MVEIWLYSCCSIEMSVSVIFRFFSCPLRTSARNIEVCCEKKGRNVMDIDGFSCERELHEVKQGFFYSLWIFLACVQRPRRSSTIFFLYRGKSLLSETQGLFLNHLATIFFTSKTEIFSIVSINLSPLKRSWFYEAA